VLLALASAGCSLWKELRKLKTKVEKKYHILLTFPLFNHVSKTFKTTLEQIN
jgi:hypothetical protein